MSITRFTCLFSHRHSHSHSHSLSIREQASFLPTLTTLSEPPNENSFSRCDSGMYISWKYATTTNKARGNTPTHREVGCESSQLVISLCIKKNTEEKKRSTMFHCSFFCLCLFTCFTVCLFLNIYFVQRSGL